jgi:RNA polymerase sigma-70 factor (ECF subfamily)
VITANPHKWVENYGDYLFSIALLKTSQRETAEDMVQETFMAAVKALPGFKGESNEKTWLTAILNNKVIDYYRKKDLLKNADTYLQETEQSFNSSFFETELSPVGHWTKSQAPQPWVEDADKTITQSEFYRVFEFCVSKMPPKLVPVFLSKFIDEKNAEEICKELNISSSNYWVIIHRSRLLMRKCLETNWFKN